MSLKCDCVCVKEREREEEERERKVIQHPSLGFDERAGQDDCDEGAVPTLCALPRGWRASERVRE